MVSGLQGSASADPVPSFACLPANRAPAPHAESHTLRTSNKPPDALHTEATVTAVKLARRAILLTGTPSLSRPFDLFRQVDAVAPGLLGANRICFASAYCNRREVALTVHNGERTTRWDVGGLSRGGELHDMLKAEVMLRRLKQDVLSQASGMGALGRAAKSHAVRLRCQLLRRGLGS